MPGCSAPSTASSTSPSRSSTARRSRGRSLHGIRDPPFRDAHARLGGAPPRLDGRRVLLGRHDRAHGLHRHRPLDRLFARRRVDASHQPRPPLAPPRHRHPGLAPAHGNAHRRRVRGSLTRPPSPSAGRDRSRRRAGRGVVGVRPYPAERPLSRPPPFGQAVPLPRRGRGQRSGAPILDETDRDLRAGPMTTENRSVRFVDLDGWPSGEILHALYEGQLSAVAAVRPALPAIAAAAEEAAERLRRGGRLVYAGAGTSGRIGVQDGAELPPTFDWPDDRVAFAIAGGKGAILQAVENAEDSRAEGARRHGRARRRAGRRGDRRRGERHDAVHGRRRGARPGARRGDDRGREQPGRAAPRGQRPSGPGGDRRGGGRGLDPHEGRHGPEDRAQPLLHPR